MRTLACRAIVSICALGHSAAFPRHADKMRNCADFKDDCATDAFIQKQCAATCGGGAAKAAAPTNERAEHGHSEPLTADSADVAVFAGLGRDVTLAHSDITTICRTDRGGAVVATNPAQPWIPAEGTVEGCVLVLFCKRGRLGEDGRSIEWSNGVMWVLDRRAEPRNKLEEFFYVVPKRRLVVKWDHYLAIYECHLAKFKALGRRPVVLEIGVNDGGSLDMCSTTAATAASSRSRRSRSSGHRWRVPRGRLRHKLQRRSADERLLGGRTSATQDVHRVR